MRVGCGVDPKSRVKYFHLLQFRRDSSVLVSRSFICLFVSEFLGTCRPLFSDLGSRALGSPISALGCGYTS